MRTRTIFRQQMAASGALRQVMPDRDAIGRDSWAFDASRMERYIPISLRDYADAGRDCPQNAHQQCDRLLVEVDAAFRDRPSRAVRRAVQLAERKAAKKSARLARAGQIPAQPAGTGSPSL